MERVYITQDNDGHWFIIPYNAAKSFSAILEKCTQSDDYELFEERFSSYRCDGDFNQKQIFAEL